MELTTFRIVLILFVAITLLRLIFVRAAPWYRFVKLAWTIPGPSLWSELKNLTAITDHFVDYVYQVCLSYEFKPFRMIAYGNIVVVISDPDDFAVALKHKHLSDKPRFAYEIFAYMMAGESLLTLNGSTWRRHRHAFNPGFHSQVLGSYMPLLNSQAQDFVQTVQDVCTEKTVDISGLLAEKLLINSARVNIGQNFDTEVYNNPDLVGVVKQLATLVGHPGMTLTDMFPHLCHAIEIVHTMFPIAYFNPVKFYLSYRFRVDMDRIRKIFQGWKKLLRILISAKKEEGEKLLSKGDTDTDTDISPSSSLEHTFALKDAGRFPLTDDELTEDITVLIIGAAETTAVAMNVALALLALNSGVQVKVSEELLSIFQGSDRSATMDDLKRMRYLDCVIKETLRLFSPGAFTLREAKGDVVINGTTVPKGALVGLFFWGLHRNPKYFENPLEFRPERFSADNEEKLPRYGFVPFSAGPRSCIGSNFAMIQLKTVLSTFLRSYQVRPGEGLNGVDDIKVAFGFTLRLTSKIPLRLYPRRWDKMSE